MNDIHSSLVDRFSNNVIQFIERHRVAIIIAYVALTIFSIFYIKDHLGVNTDTTDMLSRDLEWRKLDIEYEKEFPQFTDNLLIVIESNTPDQASDTASKLFGALKENPKFIQSIFYPNLLPYFRESAFLFLDTNELQDLADQLATIQPFLGTLLEDNNLRGLFTMLADAIQYKQDGEDIDLKPLLIEINRAFEESNYFVSWQKLMSNDKSTKSIYREFIVLRTLESDEEFLPGEDVIKHVRSTINSLGLINNNVNIRLTGGTALSYEELKSVSDANIKAIVISFILVAIILMIGLGSGWLVFTAITTLLFGLITTTAFAAATVGELNLISVAFAVLYIGLGIDFTIHLILRYREQSSVKSENALQKSTSLIMHSLILCAITTAIGFYSFMPTDYDGVAELGWIAGSGMFISIIFTLTLLPALLSLKPYQPNTSLIDNNSAFLNRVTDFPYTYSKQILIFSFIVLIGFITQIHKVSFDINTLNLQDPDNESVQTYRDLLQDSDSSPWSNVLLKQTKDEVLAVIEDIKDLELVDEVIWLEDLLPAEQEDKLFIIDEMNLFLGELSINQNNVDVSIQSKIAAIENLNAQISNLDDADLQEYSSKLHKNLTQLLNKNTDDINQLESQLLFNLEGRINALNAALNAEAVNLEDIPDDVKQRWQSQKYYKIKILPKENLNDNAAMTRFVKQLQEYDNTVIGSPVISIEAGSAVITAFKSAFIYALITITILLLFLIKQKTDALIILTTILIGSTFTFGFMLVFNIPLNFANIIGLPLLLGIGVDSGIHILDRFRQEQGKNKNIFRTSSTRGVLVSSLTTICSIGNLAFSSHTGTASMGLLLTVGLASMMISTMMILPAFLIWQDSKKNNNL